MDPVGNHPLAPRVPTAAERPVEPAARRGPPFAERLLEALNESNQKLKEAELASEEIAAGKGDIVETMVSLSRAELSLRLVVTLRNRLLEAYNEIMRLQV
jgi:flagellar hook-basal body complex protein FliE